MDVLRETKVHFNTFCIMHFAEAKALSKQTVTFALSTHYI